MWKMITALTISAIKPLNDNFHKGFFKELISKFLPKFLALNKKEN